MIATLRALFAQVMDAFVPASTRLDGRPAAALAAVRARGVGRGGVAGIVTLVALVVGSSALAIPPPDAVGSLYLADGGRYLCTASAVAGAELGLSEPMVVLTAAHCIEPGLRRDAATDAWTARSEFEVSFDGSAFYPVAPYRVGYSAQGFDLALLLFVDEIPELEPLHMGSWQAVDFGTAIHNFANPLGMGIQYFTGAITMLRLEADRSGRNQQWQHNAVASLQVGPGSSGSLILNDAREYIGVLSGVVEAQFGSPFTIFVPQWKFAEFLESESAARSLRCFCAQLEGLGMLELRALAR